MAKRIPIIVAAIVVVSVGCIGLAQLIPYGRNHTNPPVIQEPKWDSPQTLELAQRACFDCHSNVTKWPWYTNIAPASWLVQRDVDEGRRRLNFSEWNSAAIQVGGRGRNPQEIARTVLEGRMPPLQYTLIHSNARLTQAEKQALSDGLTASLK
jgi:Haem-binding domain